MQTTPNLGLAKYEISDKFNITQQTNSLNHNMDIIDTSVNDLKSAIDALQKNGKAITSDFLEQGSWSTVNTSESLSHKIKTKNGIYVNAGAIVYFKPGTVIGKMLYRIFPNDIAGTAQSEGGSWIENERTIVLKHSGYIKLVFSASADNVNIVPSDYDATCNVTSDVKTTIDKYGTDLEEIDQFYLANKRYITKNMLEQGSYSGSNGKEELTHKIRNSVKLYVNKGTSIYFKPGTTIGRILYRLFPNDTPGTSQTAGGTWITTESTIEIGKNGYLALLFSASADNVNIVPSDYDATCLVTAQVKNDINKYGTDLEEIDQFYLADKRYITKDMLEQGAYSVTNGKEELTHKIRNSVKLYINKGTSIYFKPGTTIGRILYRLFPNDTPGTSQTAGGTWITTESTIEIGKNGYLALLFSASADNVNIVPSDYDATCLVTAQVKNDIDYYNTVLPTIINSNDFVTLVPISDVVADNSKFQQYADLFGESDEHESFMFFTDPHLLQEDDFLESRFTSCMAELKRYFNATPVNFAVCNGDWFNKDDTDSELLAKLGYADSLMRDLFNKCYYFVIGNHEYNYLQTGGIKPVENWLSWKQVRNIVDRDKDYTYYKFDGTATRFYVLDTMTGIPNDTTLPYEKQQIVWLANSLISDDRKHSAIFMHMYFISQTPISADGLHNMARWTKEIVRAYNLHTTATIDDNTYNFHETFDFTGKTGHVEFIMCGHTHQDFDSDINNMPIVCSTWVRDGDVPTFDLVHVDYDNHKLNLIRIGTGNNRSFNLVNYS